jgi:hypothetical protein
MRLREEITRPGFVIDLMTAALIVSAPVLVVVALVEVPAHVIYHRGPDWQRLAMGLAKRAACYAAACGLTFGVRYLWRRRKTHGSVSN